MLAQMHIDSRNNIWVRFSCLLRMNVFEQFFGGTDSYYDGFSGVGTNALFKFVPDANAGAGSWYWLGGSSAYNDPGSGNRTSMFFLGCSLICCSSSRHREPV